MFYQRTLECAMMHLCKDFIQPGNVEKLLSNPDDLLSQVETHYARMILFLDVVESLKDERSQIDHITDDTGTSYHRSCCSPSQDLSIFWICVAVMMHEMWKRAESSSNGADDQSTLAGQGGGEELSVSNRTSESDSIGGRVTWIHDG